MKRILLGVRTSTGHFSELARCAGRLVRPRDVTRTWKLMERLLMRRRKAPRFFSPLFVFVRLSSLRIPCTLPSRMIWRAKLLFGKHKRNKGFFVFLCIFSPFSPQTPKKKEKAFLQYDETGKTWARDAAKRRRGRRISFVALLVL